jgi:hypothetical protein
MSLTIPEAFFEGMAVESTVNIPDWGDVKLEINKTEDVALRMSMPRGIDERCGNNNFSEEDNEWISKCVVTATDIQIEELAHVPEKKLAYLASSVIRMLCRKEPKSYYNFVEENMEDDKSLMEQGSWQVKDD